MKALLYYLAWEWINISIEFTATAYVKLRRWFAAVVFVNLATHPLFVFLLEKFGRSNEVILSCEAAIVAVEAVLLTVIYGRGRWLRLFLISLLMNAASYLTGVLLGL
jgi:hypothetical protein